MLFQSTFDALQKWILSVYTVKIRCDVDWDWIEAVCVITILMSLDWNLGGAFPETRISRPNIRKNNSSHNMRIETICLNSETATKLATDYGAPKTCGQCSLPIPCWNVSGVLTFASLVKRWRCIFTERSLPSAWEFQPFHSDMFSQVFGKTNYASL